MKDLEIPINNNYHINFQANTEINKLINSLIVDFQEVKCIFVSGSAARGGNDEFSDVDLNVVINDPDSFLKSISSFVKKQDILFSFEPHYLKNIIVLYLRSGVKLDIMLYDTENDFSSFTLDRIKIILDKSEGYLLSNKIENKIKKTVPNDLAFKYLSLGLADLYAVAREISRKNLHNARFNLDEARHSLMVYFNLLNNSEYFYPHRFENFITPEQADFFEKSIVNNADLVDIKKSAIILLEVVKTLNFFQFDAIEMINKKLINSI